MKKNYALLLIVSTFFSTLANAQSFSDDFDTYTAGSYLAKSNSKWKTWANTPGGADDVKISSAKAKSGTNSIYFSAGSTGGPSDVVLPFGGEYVTGTLNLSMWMFIDNQRKAYINIQEQATLGKGWSVDINFDSLGVFSLVNTTSGVLLAGSYTQNTWMKVELKMDLNSNTWNFLINDISMGTFQNTYRKISSLDIYSVANSSFYIDDVNYTYTPYVKPTLNGTISFIENLKGKLAAQVVKPSVEIRNLGTQVINSASIEFVYNGVKQTKDISGLTLASLATQVIAMDNSIVILPGVSMATATVKTVNGVSDDNTNDNSKTIDIIAPTPAPGKIVVAEEGTGTWCQWCPRGAVWLKKMDDNYNGLIIGIAVHNADPMTYTPYDQGLGTKIKGYPSLIVDRGAAMDPSAMESDFLTRIMVAPKGTIRNGAKYNSGTRTLDVSLTTKFNQSLTGNYRIALVLTEDSVTGTASNYNQSNAYAGGGQGIMGGYEKLPNPVPASKMVYDHVARIIYPNFNGLSNAFNPSINVGDSFTHNFTVVLDPSWHSERIHVIGLLIDPNGKIDNGSIAGFDKAIQNGFLSGTVVAGVNKLVTSGNDIQVYPNPSANNFNLVIPEQLISSGEMTIYNVQGQLIQTTTLSGDRNIVIDAQDWTPGLYIGSINNNGKMIHVRLMKE